MRAKNKIIPMLTVILMAVFSANACAQRPRYKSKKPTPPSPSTQKQKYILVDTGQINCYNSSTEITDSQVPSRKTFTGLKKNY